MILRRLTLKGLTVYQDAQVLDLDGLPDGVVAIVGKNGSGKTTLLEAVTVALWGKLPSRAKAKSVYDYANGSDGFVELDFLDGGDEILVRLMIDAERRKSERLVWINDQAVEPKEIQATIAERFGSPELFLASVFSAQSKKGRFSELPRAERKALFVEMLGAEKLQVLSEAAGERGAVYDLEVRDGQRKIAGAEIAMGEVCDAPALEAELRLRIKDRGEAKPAAEKRAATAAKKLREARERKDRLEASTAPGEAIEAKLKLWARAKKLSASASQRYEEEVGKIRDGMSADQEKASRLEEYEAAAARLAEIDQVLEEDRKAGVDLDAAAGEMTEAGRAVESVGEFLSLARSTLGRLENQAQGIAAAPCSPADLWTDEATKANKVDLRGTCPLLEGARSAAAELKTQRAEVAKLEKAKEEAIATRDASVRAHEALAAPWHGRREEINKLLEERKAVSATAVGVPFAQEAAKRLELYEAREKAALETRSRELKEAAALCPDEAAEVLEARLEALREAAQAEAQEVAALDFDALEAEEARSRGDLGSISGELEELQRKLGRAQAQAEAYRKAKEALEAARETTNAARDVLADWKLLGEALGRNGAQALLVDAAGPEVAEIANKILEACYSTRFQLAIRTLKPKAKGGGFQEVFSIKVFDNGQERDLEDLSGGEGAVASEALGLALGVFNAQRSGVVWETLIRDETASPLDAENRPRYVQMLRRARELGGFVQVPFVAHAPELWEASDAQVWVNAGTLVAGPPE